MMLDERIRKLKGFPPELGLLLKHMILSHHGSLEFGSPVRPATAEALVLHHIENLDAKLNHLYCHLENCQPEQEWAAFDRILSTEICRIKYKKDPRLTMELEEALTGRR
jgi:3'-5' exoribonuclease